MVIEAFYTVLFRPKPVFTRLPLNAGYTHSTPPDLATVYDNALPSLHPLPAPSLGMLVANVVLNIKTAGKAPA
ncbi:hypothetical protein GMSM_46030 [Geomonas sp. Red276]